MARDAEATRERLLLAAVDEFSVAGLAGGRVDRIAASAKANKRAIYDHFGSKDGLFAAAVERVSHELIDALPLDGRDLPGYAGKLFDYLIDHPQAGRLLGWRRLERPDAPTPTSPDFFDQMGQIVDGGPGVDGRITPVDLVILVIALANAWWLTAREIAVVDGTDPTEPRRIATHRAAVVEATRRLTGQ